MKITDTRSDWKQDNKKNQTGLNTKLTQSLSFIIYIVTDMKSPRLLSTVHDLVILHTICSVVTKRDFVTTTQTSLHSTRPTLPCRLCIRNHIRTMVFSRTRISWASWPLPLRVMLWCFTLTTIVCLSLARWSYIRHDEQTNKYCQCIHRFESSELALHVVVLWVYQFLGRSPCIACKLSFSHSRRKAGPRRRPRPPCNHRGCITHRPYRRHARTHTGFPCMQRSHVRPVMFHWPLIRVPQQTAWASHLPLASVRESLLTAVQTGISVTRMDLELLRLRGRTMRRVTCASRSRRSTPSQRCTASAPKDHAGAWADELVPDTRVASMALHGCSSVTSAALSLHNVVSIGASVPIFKWGIVLMLMLAMHFEDFRPPLPPFADDGGLCRDFHDAQAFTAFRSSSQSHCSFHAFGSRLLPRPVWKDAAATISSLICTLSALGLHLASLLATRADWSWKANRSSNCVLTALVRHALARWLDFQSFNLSLSLLCSATP